MKTHYLRISSLIPLFLGALSALAGVQLVQPASAQSQLQTLLTADFAQTQDISGVGLVTGLAGMTWVFFGTPLAWPWYALAGSAGTFAAGLAASYAWPRTAPTIP